MSNSNWFKDLFIDEAKPALNRHAGGSTGGSGGAGGGSSEPEWFNDGDTHIWIELGEGRTSPILGFYNTQEKFSKVTIDFGDGTGESVCESTTSGLFYSDPHNYASPGDYVVRLTPTDNVRLHTDGTKNSYSYTFRHSIVNDVRNNAYRNTIRKAEINGAWFGQVNGFRKCVGLKSVNIIGKYTEIGTSAFNGCTSLIFVNLPEGLELIGNYAFSSCSALTKIDIPGTVKRINTYAFSDCGGIRYFDFTNHTEVPALGDTAALAGLSDDCEIRVPAALYDEWIAATNWVAYASQIVAV